MNSDALSVYQGPVLVSVAYVFVYYVLHVYGLRTKLRLGREYRRRGERFDRYFGQDRTMLAADRYVLNMLEHMPPFLCLLWLHAVFVGPSGATIGGSIYVGTRAAYPFLLGETLASGLPKRVLFATFAGYAVLVYMAVALCWRAAR